MTRREAAQLKVGDRVILRGNQDDQGTVTQVGYCAVTITWDNDQVGIIHHQDMGGIAAAPPEEPMPESHYNASLIPVAGCECVHCAAKGEYLSRVQPAATATPGPWRALALGLLDHCRPGGSRGRLPAGRKVAFTTPIDYPPEVRAANAALIVRAVNCHADLVGALTRIDELARHALTGHADTLGANATKILERLAFVAQVGLSSTNAKGEPQ